MQTRNKQKGLGITEFFGLVFLGTTGTMIADTEYQKGIAADAPKCAMETVKADGGNYYYTRQKPGACKL